MNIYKVCPLNKNPFSNLNGFTFVINNASYQISILFKVLGMCTSKFISALFRFAFIL